MPRRELCFHQKSKPVPTCSLMATPEPCSSMKQKLLSVIGVTDNMQGSIYVLKESQTLRERRTESHGSLKQFDRTLIRL